MSVSAIVFYSCLRLEKISELLCVSNKISIMPIGGQPKKYCRLIFFAYCYLDPNCYCVLRVLLGQRDFFKAEQFKWSSSYCIFSLTGYENPILWWPVTSFSCWLSSEVVARIWHSYRFITFSIIIIFLEWLGYILHQKFDSIFSFFVVNGPFPLVRNCHLAIHMELQTHNCIWCFTIIKT